MREVLTRQECSAMRGIAILAIMLHNYSHWLKGIVRENEYIWSAAKTDQFWAILQNPDELLPLHLLSFFGHYGVPVFLFLSGYGLVMKYETLGVSKDLKEPKISVWRFIRYNYLKLFRIMIVGIVAFTMLDAITAGAHHYRLIDVVGMLGMFSNLLEHPAQVIWPGPYWYFGLTLQLYILYRLVFYRWRHWGVVAVAVAVCWLLQEIWLDDIVILERLRYNFIGGMLPFAMGILLARGSQKQTPSFLIPNSEFPYTKLGVSLGVTVFAVLLIIVMSLSQQAWLWVPVLIVVGTIALVKLLPEAVLDRLVWVGGISAAIFVTHPLVRKVFFRLYFQDELYAGLLLYVVASLVVAWLFMQIINRIPKPRL